MRQLEEESRTKRKKSDLEMETDSENAAKLAQGAKSSPHLVINGALTRIAAAF